MCLLCQVKERTVALSSALCSVLPLRGTSHVGNLRFFTCSGFVFLEALFLGLDNGTGTEQRAVFFVCRLGERRKRKCFFTCSGFVFFEALFLGLVGNGTIL